MGTSVSNVLTPASTANWFMAAQPCQQTSASPAVIFVVASPKDGEIAGGLSRHLGEQVEDLLAVGLGGLGGIESQHVRGERERADRVVWACATRPLNCGSSRSSHEPGIDLTRRVSIVMPIEPQVHGTPVRVPSGSIQKFPSSLAK